MDPVVLKKNIGKLVGQRNIFLVFSAFLSIAVVALSLLLFSKNERVVILPTNGQGFWIENEKASGAYIEKMGLFLSDLLLNRSPIDVEKRNQIILEHVHPSSYHEFKKILSQEQESILKGDQAFFFQAALSSANAAAHTFTIEGDSCLLLGKEGKSLSCLQKRRHKYTLRFQAENGKLYLTSMKKEDI